MKILLVHNYYQLAGGEDEVFRREKELLADAGHEVIEYTRHNNEINGYNIIRKVSLAGRTIWASDSRRDLDYLLRRASPDVVHFHNTFPLISPSAYYACAAAGVPVVQTLHNSRLFCPAGTLYRDGQPCNDCLGRGFSWPAVQHACYQDSRPRSAVIASMLLAHRWLKTWDSKVNKYVVFTEYYRKLFTQAGIPAEKIVLKPHFVESDPGPRDKTGNYALFVGRLAEEKGIRTLLTAWEQLPYIPLKIRGEGPLAAVVQLAMERQGSSVIMVPRPTREGLLDLMKGARVLVWPSAGYNETFGLVAAEAFACGVPVIASRIGAMSEMVREGNTGLNFRPGDSNDLMEKVNWAWAHPDEMEEMGKRARAEFQAKYTKQHNYAALMEIYHSVLALRPLAKTISVPAFISSATRP